MREMKDSVDWGDSGRLESFENKAVVFRSK